MGTRNGGEENRRRTRRCVRRTNKELAGVRWPGNSVTRGSRMGVQQNAGRAGRIVAGAGTPDLPPVGRHPAAPFSSRGPRGCLRCKAGPKGRGAIDGWRMRGRTGVFDNLKSCDLQTRSLLFDDTRRMDRWLTDLINSAITAPRSVAQLVRAPVSKTGGWGFESLHSCQPGGAVAIVGRRNRDRRRVANA